MTAVRRAGLADAEGMAQTAVAAWRAGFAGIVPEEIRPERGWNPERIAEQLAAREASGRETLVAVDAERVVGLVVLGPSRDVGAPAREGEVIALYVHPDEWRQGVGRVLVAEALSVLRARGFGEAIVWTLADSPRNLAFYEALGFRADGGTQRRPSFGSTREVRLRLPLGRPPTARRAPGRRLLGGRRPFGRRRRSAGR